MAESLETGHSHNITDSSVKLPGKPTQVMDKKEIETDKPVFKMPSVLSNSSGGPKNNADVKQDFTMSSSHIDAIDRSEILKTASCQGEDDEPCNKSITLDDVNTSSPGMEPPPAQQIIKDKLKLPLPYKEPPWGGMPPPPGPGNKALYRIEELKNGMVS